MRHASFGKSFVRSHGDRNVERPLTVNPCCLGSESILCFGSWAHKNSTGQFLSLNWVLSIHSFSGTGHLSTKVEERTFLISDPE